MDYDRKQFHYGRPDKIAFTVLEKTTRQWWAGQGWLAQKNNIKKYTFLRLGYYST